MRLMLWRAGEGDEPVQVECSTDHWVGDLQPLVEEPFRAGDWKEAHIGRTHFHVKADALASMIQRREDTLKDLDLTEKLLKEQLKDSKAKVSEHEKSLEALLKLKESL
jgi:hypothetical protein